MARVIQVGELIPSMGRLLQESLDRCIAKNKHRREVYYIFVHGQWLSNGTILDMPLSSRDTLPPKMLNTMCWSVNNKTGELKELWVLPPDAPIQITKKAPIVDSIAKDVQGIPILY